jgi:hypothetical protein
MVGFTKSKRKVRGFMLIKIAGNYLLILLILSVITKAQTDGDRSNVLLFS